MGFIGKKMMSIDDLGLTQIYLSQKKIEKVLKWFKKSLEGFEPVPVHDFLGNGDLYLSDGHTRAFVAWLNGVKEIPVVYDEDEIITCEIGQILYKKDIGWCERIGLHHVSSLKNRIISQSDYETFWMGRCGALYRLEMLLLENKVDKNLLEQEANRLEEHGYFIHGITEDLKFFCCDNNENEVCIIENEIFKGA
jgi:hypothetical protein